MASLAADFAELDDLDDFPHPHPPPQLHEAVGTGAAAAAGFGAGLFSPARVLKIPLRASVWDGSY